MQIGWTGPNRAASIQPQDNARPTVVSTKDRKENDEHFLTLKSRAKPGRALAHFTLAVSKSPATGIKIGRNGR
jgi:hypothetical protein